MNTYKTIRLRQYIVQAIDLRTGERITDTFVSCLIASQETYSDMFQMNKHGKARWPLWLAGNFYL